MLSINDLIFAHVKLLLGLHGRTLSNLISFRRIHKLLDPTTCHSPNPSELQPTKCAFFANITNTIRRIILKRIIL